MKTNRKKSRVNKKRWAAYAAAGAATAVGTSATLDAQITHVVVNQTIADSDPGDAYFETFGPFTVGGTSQQAFEFRHAFVNYATSEGQLTANWVSPSKLDPGVGLFAGEIVNAFNYPSNVPYGQFVSALTQFTNGALDGYMAWRGGYTNSNFTDSGISYLAFQFDIGNGTQYGWARFDIEGASRNTAVLIDYAYGAPGQPIFVGETGSDIPVAPTSITTTRGTYVDGGLTEIGASDNLDYRIQRASNDIQSRTEFEVKAISPTATPVSFEVTLEGAVFARSNVVQSIELFDYDAAVYEIVDMQNAARAPSPDLVVTAAATGDLSRFVEDGTNCVKARVRYRSDNPRQQFTSNTDQFFWTIQ